MAIFEKGTLISRKALIFSINLSRAISTNLSFLSGVIKEQETKPSLELLAFCFVSSTLYKLHNLGSIKLGNLVKIRLLKFTIFFALRKLLSSDWIFTSSFSSLKSFPLPILLRIFQSPLRHL